MKRKFLAVLLAVAMIATQMTSIIVMASTEEVTKTYFDIDFENWTKWGDNPFDGGKQSDGTAISHGWAGNPWYLETIEDSDRGGKVIKANLTTTGGGTFLIRTRMDDNILPATYGDVDVLWNEFSIKYEGGFAGFGTNENDAARNIVNINKNGQIALGAFRGHCEVVPEGTTEQEFAPGVILPDVQLELGKWYDIKVATDFTDAGASTGVPAYVWVNDELVAYGTKIPNITPSTPWDFHDFYFDQAENEGTMAYVDDVKTYETAVLGEIELPDDAVIKNHFDISFENWTKWGDNPFDGGKQSDGTAISHGWGGNPWQLETVDDSDRGGKVLKANLTTTGGGSFLIRTRMNDGVLPANYSNAKVLWNEFSIKYEGGFAGFGTNENDAARNIVNINKNGQIALGALRGHCEVVPEGTTEQEFAPGTILSDVQLELGKWYDIKVAADFTDAAASSSVPAYVWVNDELVAYGTKIPDISKSTPWDFHDFYFDQAEAECTAYVDDVKVYETVGLGEIKLPDDMVIKNYVDMSFDNWTSGLGNIKNRDGSSINHDTNGDTSVVSPATVSDRAGQVMKVDVKTSGGANYLFRTRMNRGVIPADHSNAKVLWNEFSIKYEGGFAGFGTNEDDNAYNIVNINKNGQIALGTRWGYGEVGGGNFAAGTILPDVQLELGKWYDIKVAADFTDPDASSGVPAYVWLNGKLVAYGTKIPNITPSSIWVFQKFYFDQAENEGTTAYVDDVKTYETSGLGEIEIPDDMIIKSYFDFGIENWINDDIGFMTNTDGSSLNLAGAGDHLMASRAQDSDRGQVMKVDVATSGGLSSGNNGFLLRARKSGYPSNYEGVNVLWNEFSIKYEGGFAGFGTNENNGGRNILNINKNGQLVLGAKLGHCEYAPGGTSEGDFKPGIILTGVQLELGKWYDIKVAADFSAEDAGTGVTAYVWVNGKLVADGVKIEKIKTTSPWEISDFYFDQAEKEGTIAYIDAVKQYETSDLGSDIVKDKANVMTDALNSISANIATRNETFHPVSAMADGSKEGDSLYKSEKVAKEAEELKVVASLGGVYEISSVTVTERWLNNNGLKVSVEIGKNGNLTKVVDNQGVNQGSEPGAVDTVYPFVPTEGDTIVYTFTVDNHRWPENEEDLGKTESDYQIYELAANGYYVEDVEATGFVPEIGHWYHSNDNAITRYYINCYNAGDVEITGKFFVAAYEGNKLVKLVDAADVTIHKGANTISCTETSSLYNENWTYKAFIWDELGGLRPIIDAVDIIK